MSCKPRVQSKLTSLLQVLGGGTIAFAGICIYHQNEKMYTHAIMPVLHRFVDPEDAHKLVINIAAKYPFLVPSFKIEDKLLQTNVLGLQFDNPIGLAAGFDKDGISFPGLFKLGFGFIEIGSVTPNPQLGNPKPRVFRFLSSNSIINRYGFNSCGHDQLDSNLESNFSSKKSISNTQNRIVGLNLGKNKSSDVNSIDDYVRGLERFLPNPNLDYFVINISSPNTPGLRTLQHDEQLKNLIDGIAKVKKQLSKDNNLKSKPILLKISPDLSDQDRKSLAKCILTANKNEKIIDGLIISNTTISRPDDISARADLDGAGLSGVPLKDLSTKLISDMYKLTNGSLVIIGVGGVFSGKDAFEKIASGASLIQIYSSLTLIGPQIVKQINQELAAILREKGFSSVSQAVGSGKDQV